MSMISAQIDELRRLAGDGSTEWVTGPIRASVLRDAADTILELRDDLQRANAENARLRSELESVGTAAYLYGRSDLMAENAKLRKQIASFIELSQDMVIYAGRNMERHFAKRLRKLGVPL